MESGEGNKGTKRKSEENAEESANKHLRLDLPSTSLGTGQDKQGQEDTNWMKHVKVEYEDAPKCALCDKEHSFDIKPITLKIHLKTHQIRLRKKETDWIFNHFNIVKHEDYLKCTHCNNFCTKVQFKGSLVNHIKEELCGKRAEQDGESSQGSPNDSETAAKLIQYLFRKYLVTKNATRLMKRQISTKLITWWRDCCDTENYQTDEIKCKLCEGDKFFTVTIQPVSRYKMHMKRRHKDIKVEEAEDTKWFAEQFQFASNAVWCIICRKSFALSIYDKTFVKHLEDIHNVPKVTSK